VPIQLQKAIRAETHGKPRRVSIQNFHVSDRVPIVDTEMKCRKSGNCNTQNAAHIANP
jgi:hypothetical protein